MQTEYKGRTVLGGNWRTMGYMVRGFAVTKVTIIKWMRKLEMPHIRIEGDKQDNLRFDMSKVLPWAKQNGKVWHEPQKRLRLEPVNAAC